MSDQPDAEAPLPELTPEQESTVRRYLAEARHTEPLPADVATRLDDVLAELARQNPGEPSAPVVDLAARRRRRNAGRLLAAAAAVIVVGVGVGQVIGTGTTSDDSAGSAVDSQEAPAREDSDDRSAPAPESVQDLLPLQLTTDGLEGELTDQLRDLPTGARSLDQGRGATADQELLAEPGFTCANVPAGAGQLLPAYVDGKASVVVLAPAADDGTQRADVVDCETGAPGPSVTLPAP